MYKILVVENNEELRLLYKKELLKGGYIVITAKDGHGAIKNVNDYWPDVVVMDIDVPDIDVMKVVENIRSQPKMISIIINTSYNSYKGNYLGEKADDYIFKTSDLKELKDKVMKCISKMEDEKLVKQFRQTA